MKKIAEDIIILHMMILYEVVPEIRSETKFFVILVNFLPF